MDYKLSNSTSPWFLPFLFIFTRILFFLGMVSNGLNGFGDVPRYFEVAALNGFPYFTYWMEYPPIFAFLNKIIFQLTGGEAIFYDPLMFFIFTMAGALALYIFQQLDFIIFGNTLDRGTRTWLYLIILLVLPYTWWYFEMIPVALMLWGILLFFNEKPIKSGIVIGIGILTKWFPGLILPAIWRIKSRKTIVIVTTISLGLMAFIYILLWGLTPIMTRSSLLSQPNRNSWQTIWAWMDGNYMNGAFALPEDRYNPDYPLTARIGNPPVVPPILKLIIFSIISFLIWYKFKGKDYPSFLALNGIIWAMFLLWSSGWSPQWILYLIPIILLTFPLQKGIFINLLFLLLTIFEWPTLLGHKLFEFMGPIAVLRSIFLIYLIISWVRNSNSFQVPSHKSERAGM